MWTEEAIEMLRVMVDDYGATPKYSDAQLTRVLVVAAYQVLTEVEFPAEYSVSISGQSITPDPSQGEGKNDSFMNLLCMKAACVIDRGTAATAAGRAISVRDGGSSVDLRGVFQGKFEILKRGWCATYEDAKLDYQAGESSTAGAVVTTPFRLLVNGNKGETWL